MDHFFPIANLYMVPFYVQLALLATASLLEYLINYQANVLY